MPIRTELPLALTGSTSPLVLIGGSGDVGRRLLRMLQDKGDLRVSVVSRRASMPDIIGPENLTVLPIDIRNDDALSAFPEGATVVNLTEATPPAIAANVVAQGGVFIDTSATPTYSNDLARAADFGPGLLVLCVGAAPGLSTLMAADLGRMTDTRAIDIGLELGMGRHYGRAATEWFFRALGTRYILSASDQEHSVEPGLLRRSFSFGENERSRLALGVGFTELGIASAGRRFRVRTFLAIDPPFVTRLIGGMLKLGLNRWLAGHAEYLTSVVGLFPSMSQSRTRITVEAISMDEQCVGTHHLSAGDQAELTAAMILLTLRAISKPGVPRCGVTTIADHLTFESALFDLPILLPNMTIRTWED